MDKISSNPPRSVGRKSKSGKTGTETGTGTPTGTPTQPAGDKETAPTLQSVLDDVTDLPGIPEGSIYEDEALTVKEEQAPQPPEDEKGAAWRANPQARKLAKKEAQQTAIIVLTLLDGIVSMFFGPAASMLDYEKDMMQAPLERMLQRMDIVNSEALAKWSDPILFTMGLIAWGSRISRERAENRPNQEPPGGPPDNSPEPPKPPAPTGARKNGNPPGKDIILTEQLTAPQEIRKQIGGEYKTI